MSDYRFIEPYAARRVAFLGVWSQRGWRMKLYGIACASPRPAARLVAAAKRVAAATLPEPARTASRYGVGFIGVHEGRGANLVFVDWWADENELRHRVFTSTAERPDELVDDTSTGRIACVWDLAVLAFERRAWINAVLLHPERPSFDDYLACRFDGIA